MYTIMDDIDVILGFDIVQEIDFCNFISPIIDTCTHIYTAPVYGFDQLVLESYHFTLD